MTSSARTVLQPSSRNRRGSKSDPRTLKAAKMQVTQGNRLRADGPQLCRHSKQPIPRINSYRPRRSAGLVVQAKIRARWCIDIRYGVKMDAIALLSEWVQDIGSQAGLSDNVNILSGAVGVPESRLEVRSGLMASAAALGYTVWIGI